MERRRFLIEDIHIGERHRKPDVKKVSEIVASLRDIGYLMSPPAVCIRNDVILADGEISDAVPVLIYGRHRLLALAEIGEDTVECVVFDVDEDHATIMEADENLARSEIQGAERTRSVKAREAAWNRIREREGKSIVQNLDDGKVGYKKPPVPQKQFATETASASGMSRSAIYQELKRAEVLGDEGLDKIEKTSLDKGVEMDALIKMPAPERAELIERAAAGEKVSARPAPAPKPMTADRALDIMAADIIASHKPASIASPLIETIRAAEEDAVSGARTALDEFLGRFACLTADQRRECLAGRDLAEVFDAYTK